MAGALLGRALYRAAGARAWDGPMGTWLARRSAARRWLPTGGQEWGLVPAAGRFTGAFHVLRLLCGGLRGVAGARTRAERDAHPWACTACGGPGACWAWRTPSPEQPGLACC